MMSFLKEYIFTRGFLAHSVAKNCHRNGTMPFCFAVLLLEDRTYVAMMYRKCPSKL